MKQKIRRKRNFKFGGNAIFQNPSDNLPALITVINSCIATVEIALKKGQKSYFPSDCTKYNLANPIDIMKLKIRGIIRFEYQTPTQLNI